MRSLRNSSAPGDNDESPLRSVLLIGLLLGSVLLISVAVLVVFIVSRSSGSTSGIGLLMPYNVELRNMPAANTADSNALLPATIGPFSRKSISGSIGAITGSLTAAYAGTVTGVSGPSSISIRVNLDANDDQASTDFGKLANIAPWPRQSLQQIRGAGYFQSADPKSSAVRLVFVQHFWLFDITASSKAALDAFMAAFAY